jgi:hypothetical protein
VRQAVGARERRDGAVALVVEHWAKTTSGRRQSTADRMPCLEYIPQAPMVSRCGLRGYDSWESITGSNPDA